MIIQAPEAFKRYRQFILWRPTPGGPGGKIIKRPISPHTLRTHDPHDPSVWMDYETASSLAGALDLGLGFVFTAADPFFFLDIDGKSPGDISSPLATDLCNRLAGCAVEISQSGCGLHVFGSADSYPPHQSNPSAVNLEFYTTKRFVALTGDRLQGSADYRPASGVIEWVISSYFPVVVETPGAAQDDWTEGPCLEWDGPRDDQDLIARMLKSKSVGAMFGSRSSIAALWTADADTLSTVFPSPTGQPFNHSNADAALCAHLAWWTGRDCERMDRLFRMSQLCRGKWLDREDYRRVTIMGACHKTTRVMGQREPSDGPPAPPLSDGTEPPPPPEGYRVGMQWATISQQVEMFRSCVYVRDLHRVFVPDGALLKPDQFKAMYGGYLFSIDAGGKDKTVKNAFEAFTESQGYNFPKAHGVCFRPELPPGVVIQEEGSPLVNTYVPVLVPRKFGDPGRILELMEKILPVATDRNILLQYMAACVQLPGQKFQWWPLLQGTQGNGKTLLAHCIANAVGWKYTHTPNAADLNNKFNAWVLSKLFILIEEICAGDKVEVIEALKPLITNTKIEIQGKGSNQVVGDNRANGILLSNHKNAIRLAIHDRRYAVLFSAQQEKPDILRDGMTPDYFHDLWTWCRDEGFAIFTNYLHEYPITPDFRRQLMYRAPQTTSTGEAVELSKGGIEQEMDELLDSGTYGFVGGWISSLQFNLQLAKNRKTAITPALRKTILQGLGYVPHPGLRKGRVDNIMIEEGGKPVLYIKADHPAAAIMGSPAVVRAYLEAQKS